MKSVWHGIGFLLVFLVACTQPDNDHCRDALNASPQDIISPTLSVIDSLLWQQPDSALMRLLPYFDTCIATEYNRHYAHLLLAELLYKNDYAQTNRAELQQAVAYFDSLVRQVSPPFKGAGGIKNKNSDSSTHAFLDARAHYINGVGYYENDSAVPACAEYMKALEVMEGHFTEKELVGKKAKFMALTYTHLTALFSDLYLHEQAIYFGKMALGYYQKYNAIPWHLAWILEEIGSHYDMMNSYDSAEFYYRKSLMVLPERNNLICRDIATRFAFLFYKMGEPPQTSLNQLHKLIGQSETQKEALSRCAIVGEIYYHEKQFDSAWIYLNKVFQESQSIDSKKQIVEWLVDICKVLDREDDIVEYAGFLVPFATQDEDKGIIKSQLAELYNMRKQQELEHQHRLKIKKQTIWSSGAVIGLLMVTLGLFILYQRYKRKKQSLEAQIKEEQYAHEIRQKALSGRLKQSNKALRMQKKETSDLVKGLDLQRRQTEWSQLKDFMNESICHDIVKALYGKQIKRESKRSDYLELHLNDAQLHELSVAVEKHFCGFEKTLTDLYPKISRNAMNQCLLYLLNLEDVQIAALLSCDYSTVKRRSTKLKQAFGTEKELRQFIREFVS